MTLEVRNLRVTYGRALAVQDVSCRVEPAKLVAIVGANGAGKSTLLRTISGLVRPAGGSITFEGREIAGRPAHAIARSGIVHVPEGRGLLPSMTVAENLRLGEYGRRSDDTGLRFDRQRIFELFPGLRRRLHEPAGVLSGGEQQMLSIARVLLKAPKILMIDEMSLGLAPLLVAQIMGVIAEIARSGVGVLCIEQSTRLVLKHADYAYVVENGRVTLEGEAASLAKNGSVVGSYLGRHAGAA